MPQLQSGVRLDTWSAALAPPGQGVLLLSELFPPTVGGSAVLLAGIYQRLNAGVSVLTHGESAENGKTEDSGPFAVSRRPMKTPSWGVSSPTALSHHLRVAWHVRRLMPRRQGVVHCARALPEGLAAYMSHLMGGPRYVCWAHGEDLTTAMGSREYLLLSQKIFGAASAAIANSQNTASLLVAMGVAEHKIEVVYPAVDSGRFHPQVDGRHIRQRFAGPDDILLLSVGRLQRRKGQDAAIEAMAALKDDLPNLRYVVVGDGEDRERLEALVVRHGLQQRVFLAGLVPERELAAYYAACDVFLLPNRVHEGDIEGFGIVFLEAAASGKPVIGGDSGGVPEAVERNVTGLLVDGSVGQVVTAIRTLATSDHLRRQFGLAGRVRADGLFSWQRAAAAVSALQQRVTAGN